MIGGVAGAASVFGNTPIDVVKTRMQVRHNELACLPQSTLQKRKRSFQLN